MTMTIVWGVALYRMGGVGHGPPKTLVGLGHNTFGPTNIWPLCLLILRKICKIGAIRFRCQILRLKFTKFDRRWGSAPNPVVGAYSAYPGSLVLSCTYYLRGPFLSSKGKKRKGELSRREGNVKRGEEVEAGIWPTQKFWRGAPYGR